ncbi:MAG: hypothetical protein Q8Q05_01445 [bacterium]|nr:hypothetical protein [bacterium]
MRFCSLTLLAVLAFVPSGCGGGGAGNSTGFQSRQDSFTVAANQASSQLFGEIGVEVSAGTYPSGANLTLKQMSQAAQMPPTTNFKLGKPALELSSDATATKDLVVSIPDDGKQYIAGIEVDGEWLPLRSVKANSRIHFTLPTTFGRSPEDGPGQIWRWVIGLVKDNLSDTEYAIKQLTPGAPFASPRTILCAHGILDNWQSMMKFVGPVLAKYEANGVYSFAFPWKAGAKAAGIELAALLAPYKNQLKNITIIGYSQGVLAVRYALERLGLSASVKNCIYLMGPNLGSYLANTADFAFEIGRFWLNANVSGSPFDIDIDDPAIKEFKPGNPFLVDLNSSHGSPRPDVNYYVLSGGRDWVVDANSGQAIGVPLEEIVSGSIWRGTVPEATHFNIKSDVNVIYRMFDSLPPVVL